MQLPLSISPPFLWTSHLICPYPPCLQGTSPLPAHGGMPPSRPQVLWQVIPKPASRGVLNVLSPMLSGEVEKWSLLSSVSLLITWVPKQLCQHSGSHQVAPSTPRTPTSPPLGLGNLEEWGISKDLCVFQRSPTLSPQGLMHNPLSWALSRHQATHPVSSYSFLHLCHKKKKTLCSSSYKAKTSRCWCVWERDRECYLHLQSTIIVYHSGTLGRSKPGRSLLSEGVGGINQEAVQS